MRKRLRRMLTWINLLTIGFSMKYSQKIYSDELVSFHPWGKDGQHIMGQHVSIVIFSFQLICQKVIEILLF